MGTPLSSVAKEVGSLRNARSATALTLPAHCWNFMPAREIIVRRNPAANEIDGDAGDYLVAAMRDGGKAVHQRQRYGYEHANDQPKPARMQNRSRSRTGESAGQHLAFKADVKNAGAFGIHAGKAGQQQRWTHVLSPNQVLVALALFLTLFVMMPTFQKSYNDGILPLLSKSASRKERGYQ